jgi:hypothetical protein
MSQQQPPQLEFQPTPKPFMTGVLFPTIFIFVTLLITQLIFIKSLPLYNVITETSSQIAPFGNSPAGQAGFSVLYLGISILAIFGIIYTARQKIKDKMFYIIAPAFLFAAILAANTIFYYVSQPVIDGILSATWLLYIMSVYEKIPTPFTLPFITIFSILAGITLTMMLPALTVLSLLLIFSLWDVYAVFRGPMIKLATTMLRARRSKYLFLAKIGRSHLGIGDLMFYSVLTSFASIFGVAIGMQTIAFTTIGFFITMWLLSKGKYKALPALPAPILLGIMGFLLAANGLFI